MKPVEERMREALSAGQEELWQFVRDPHQDVISNALLNKGLSEEMAVFVAKRRAITPETLGFLAGDVRFRGSYKLKLAICRSPKAPQRIVFSLLKFIRIFDLADITRDQQINIGIRQKVEQMIAERIPSMPSGIRTALAKRGSDNVLVALMDSGDSRAIGCCLDSPLLTEGHLYKLISRASTKGAAIRMIAEHGKWSVRYFIRFALIRSFHTPMGIVERFIGEMRTKDLRELYSDTQVPSSTKPFIFRELRERGETTDIPKEEVFDLSGNEDDDLEVGGLGEGRSGES